MQDIKPLFTQQLALLKELANLLLIFLGLMTLLGVAFEVSKPRGLVFWYAFVPVFLFCLFDKSRSKSFLSNSVWWLSVSYILFFAASMLWSEITYQGIIGTRLEQALKTLLFVTALFVALHHSNQHAKDWLAKMLIVSVVVAVGVSIYKFYGINLFGKRLYGMFSLGGNPVYAGPFLLACVICSALLFEESKGKKRYIWLVLGFLTVLLFALLSQTRTTIISVLFFISAYTFIKGGWRLTIISTLAVCVVVVFLMVGQQAVAQAWEARVQAGLNGREVIWREVWDAIQNKLVLGYGYATEFNKTTTGLSIKQYLGVKINHPHGMFFSNFFYLGLIGVILWLLPVIVLLWQSFKVDDLKFKLMVINVVVTLLMVTASDVSRIIGSYSNSWWVWWLPLIIMAVQTQKSRTKVNCVTLS